MAGQSKNIHKTICGLDVECVIVEEENFIEISLKNVEYTMQKKRLLKRIAIESILFGILNFILFGYAVFVLFNIVFLIMICVEIYLLLNLVEFGKIFAFKRKKKQNKIESIKSNEILIGFVHRNDNGHR